MTNPSQVAWHGAGHPAESHPCPTCNANPSQPCMSTVGLTQHGATGTPIRGLHAARVDATRKASAESDARIIAAHTAECLQAERERAMGVAS